MAPQTRFCALPQRSCTAYPVRRCAYAARRGLACLLEAAPAHAVGTAALAQQLAAAHAALSEMQQVAACEAEAAQHAQAAVVAEADEHARTRTALAAALHRATDLECVIAELARSRKGDCVDRRVYSWSEAAKEAQKAAARACAGLAAQRRQFAELQGSCLRAIRHLESEAADGAASGSDAAAHAVFCATEAAAHARGEAAYWQAAAEDARLEAREYGLQLQRAGDECERLEARLAAARAELAAERQQAKQQAAQQAAATYRRWSSGSFAAADAGAADKQAAAADAAEDTEQGARDTIPACWELPAEAQPAPASPAKPTHRRSASLVLC